MEQAGLLDSLRGSDPLTVFAPTDAAFARYGEKQLAALLRPANRERLRALLLYHLVPERLDVFAMKREVARGTLQGKTVKSLLMVDKMMINDAFIDIEDIKTSSGFVHGIDKVLVPPS